MNLLCIYLLSGPGYFNEEDLFVWNKNSFFRFNYKKIDKQIRFFAFSGRQFFFETDFIIYCEITVKF